MNRRALLIIVVTLALVIVAVRWRNGADPAGSGTTPSAADGKPSGSENLPSARAEPLRIIGDELTSTGRVFIVSKAGQERRVVFPPGDNPSKEEIDLLAFPPPAKPVNMVPIKTLLNQHLSFYGLVVDEKTNIVAGANVEAVIQVMNGESPMRRESVRLTSDSDGRFALEHPWGQLATITVTKRSEFIDAEPQWFQYGPVGNRPKHVPNITSPVVFELHRVKAQEPLFIFEQQFRAPNTGESVRVDLTTGKLVKVGGDLIVSTLCLEPFNSGVKYPWKLTVEAAGGGLVEAKTERLELMHEAPAGGYGSLTVEYGPNSEKYDRQHDGSYYVQSRNGQVYSKIFFYLRTRWDERGVPFGIKAVVNTNASRNLQTPVGR